MASRLYPHKEFVEYVKRVLLNRDYSFARYEIKFGRDRPSLQKDVGKHDLIFWDAGIKKLSIIRVVESYNLKSSGAIDNQTKKTLDHSRDDLERNTFESIPEVLGIKEKPEIIEKILVVTNRQVFNELGGLIAKSELSGYSNHVKLMLIPYPIIQNDFAKASCGNKVFTVSQLIGAINFGAVKLKDIPKPHQDYMVAMIRKHGYKKLKREDPDGGFDDTK